MSETAVQSELYDTTPEPDPLVGCLLLLARLHGLPASEYAVTAGLPLEDGRLMPSQFERAARRVGLRARLVKRSLGQLDALVTPALLLLDDERACVLLEPLCDGQARVQLPDNPEAESTLVADELEGLYSGYAILVSPAHRFDARTPEVGAGRERGHWFWGTLAGNWRIYRDVILASMLVNLFAIESPGLTASLALAEEVEKALDQSLRQAA